MAQTFKTPKPIIEQAKKSGEKPLHIRSFENQVSYNPFYRKVVDSLGKLNDDVDDAYFYGLKDAYEKNAYTPTEEQIRNELQDQYYRLQDSFQDNYGYYGNDWDYYGLPRFEEKYGDENTFIQKLIDAYTKNL